MALHDSVRVFDGFQSMAGGQDAGRRADLIGQDQCAAAENIVFRGGAPTTRPPIRDLTHNFLNEYYYQPNSLADMNSPANPTSIVSQTAFKTKKFQGASYYSPAGQRESIMASIGGRLFQLIPRQNNSIDIREYSIGRNEIVSLGFVSTENGPRNSEKQPVAFMCQADKYHITQDGEGRPIIFDGVRARRSVEGEIPVGTIMAYGMGRLVVTREQDIYFGDLYGSHDANDPGDSVIKFTESTYLNEGFPASITSAMGRITGAAFSPQQDSASGDGELLVFADRGVASFFLSQPRDVWKDSAFQRVTLLNVGARGHRAMVSINGDVWFRATDGWRSYRQARAEIQGWARLPMSTEVRPYIENDTEELLTYASAIHFDNRLIGTCTPQPNSGKLYHLGLLALDFDVLSSFGGASKPAWDGHWSKLKVTQLVEGMFAGVRRAFAFAINAQGENHVYELLKDGREDFDGPITSQLDGRSMTFSNERTGGPTPFNEKEIYDCDIWVDNITAPVTFELSYRPDQQPDFLPWKTLAPIDPIGECGAITCGGCPTMQPTFRPRLSFGKPPDGCDSVHTNRLLRRGYEFQTRLKWTGHASVRRLRLHGKTLLEQATANCN